MPVSLRLGAPSGCLIDRTRPLRFRFDGADYAGFAGDTIASALAAQGVWMISRSFKYHRPRAAMSFLSNTCGEPARSNASVTRASTICSKSTFSFSPMARCV